VSDAVGPILDGIKALLEGTSGVSRTISTGTFRHVPISAFEVGALAATGSTHPFTLTADSVVAIDGEQMGLAGSHVYGAHEIGIHVLYGSKPHDSLALEKAVSGDEYKIRRCLLWPRNWATVTGWTGADLVSSSRDMIGDDETQSVMMLTVTLQVWHREEQV
jgi:hypothetical protein